MEAWVWFPLSWLFVLGVWALANNTMRRISDRRYARLQRENERRKLRYEAWAAVARLGGR